MHWKKEKTNLNHYRCDHPAFKVSSIPLDTLPRCCRPWLVGWRTHRGSLQTLSRCSTALRQTTTFYGQSWLQSRAPAAIFLFPRSHILMHRWVRSSFHVAGMAVCNSHVSQLVSTGSELMALPGILQFQRQAWCVFHHVFSPRFLDQSLRHYSTLNNTSWNVCLLWNTCLGVLAGGVVAIVTCDMKLSQRLHACLKLLHMWIPVLNSNILNSPFKKKKYW